MVAVRTGSKNPGEPCLGSRAASRDSRKGALTGAPSRWERTLRLITVNGAGDGVHEMVDVLVLVASVVM